MEAAGIQELGVDLLLKGGRQGESKEQEKSLSAFSVLWTVKIVLLKRAKGRGGGKKFLK